MRNVFTLLLGLVMAGTAGFAQSNVTFRVDMNNVSSSFTTPEVNGDFNGWCGSSCNPMTDADGDNIWEVTVAITADSLEWKFAADNWAIQENLTPGSACTKTTSGFTNRFMHLNGDTILPVVCWEECVGCSSPPDTAYVTFQVDMQYVTSAFTTPEVNGDFNGWCGSSCNPMMDANGDNVWEVTVPITADSIEWKFAADNWTIQENLTEGSACTKTTSGFTNRFMHVTGDTTLAVVCWESCSACATAGPDTVSVTFMVDMNEVTDAFTTPEVNGDFNGWCGSSCNPMTDADGDNVWEVTVDIAADSIEWKFAADNWTIQEDLTEGSACTKTTSGFTNRFAVLTGDTTIPVVCWESCDACVSTGVEELGASAYTVAPNPAVDRLMILGDVSKIETVEVYNLNGQVVLTRATSNMNGGINISELNGGVYILKVTEVNEAVSFTRFVVSK